MDLTQNLAFQTQTRLLDLQHQGLGRWRNSLKARLLFLRRQQLLRPLLATAASSLTKPCERTRTWLLACR